MTKGLYRITIGYFPRGAYPGGDNARTVRVLATHVLDAIKRVKYQKGFEYIASVELLGRETK